MNATTGADNLLIASHLSVSAMSRRGREGLIRDVSFSVRTKEVLVVLGESGSGKTILSRSLTRLFPVSSAVTIDGSVTFEGRQLLNLNDRDLSSVRRHRIRYVFQEPMQSLDPLTRIRRQMRLAYDGTADDDTPLKNTLRLVGLERPDEVLDLYPHELSIGMAQRVSIAMAVLPSPALIIADEPTSAVDASLRRRILDLLITIQRSRAMSLVLITHDLDAARWYADRIIVLYDGMIIESAARQTFFDAPLHPYSRLLVKTHLAAEEQASPATLIPEPVIGNAPRHGCSFQPRCPIAEQKCREMEPELEQLTGEREVRCFFSK